MEPTKEEKNALIHRKIRGLCWHKWRVQSMPDYFSDLNACHEAEECLNGFELAIYTGFIHKALGIEELHLGAQVKLICLEAPARAEALYWIAKGRK